MKKSKYVLFYKIFQKQTKGCRSSLVILQESSSNENMALPNYLNSQTLTSILKRLENVSQKFDHTVQREALKVPETGLTLSITLLVKAVALPIFLVLSDNSRKRFNYFCLTNCRLDSKILAEFSRPSIIFCILFLILKKIS